ncbi:hypothetical protein ANN_04979 [Periplaneta americana]|uniref:Uncharacterized protein n=1 Tax=Periplaneta americana TaxID=6978 RepID=A0ABQ8TBH3_PERAM|nr:hypothetical protein ANN_04979 [Periplaneta americana]
MAVLREDGNEPPDSLKAISLKLMKIKVHEEKCTVIYHAVMISLINIIFKIGTSLDLRLVHEERSQIYIGDSQK